MAIDRQGRDATGSMDLEQKNREISSLTSLYICLSLSRFDPTLTCSLFVFQHFHRLFLRETETRNTGAGENLERAGQDRLLEECVAAIQ